MSNLNSMLECVLANREVPNSNEPFPRFLRPSVLYDEEKISSSERKDFAMGNLVLKGILSLIRVLSI